MHAALRLRHRAGAVRVARVLDRLPPPGRAGQGDHRDRPDLGWPGGDGHRRRLGRGRVPTPTASTSRRWGPAWTSWRKGVAVRARAAARRGDDVRGPLVHGRAAPATSRGRSRPGCRSGSAAAASGARCASPPATPTAGTSRSCRPTTFAAKRDVLHGHCADVGRDPGEIVCAVNVGLAWTEDSLRRSSGRSPRSCARRAHRVGRAGRRAHRPVRRRRRRPGQPGLGRRSTSTPSSSSAPRCSSLTAGRLVAAAQLVEQAPLLLPNSSCVSVPRSRIASSCSSWVATSAAGRAPGRPRRGASASRSAPSARGSGSGPGPGCGCR